MKLAELVSHLRGHRVELWAEGGKLRYSAPPGVVSPELRAELARHKPELLALLQEANDCIRINHSSHPSRPDTGRFPLSFLQERLWFIDQLSPNPAYNCYRALRVEGPLNPQALEDTLNEIVRRHEILRTNFPSIDGQPWQVVNSPSRLSVTIFDLRGNKLKPKHESEALRLITEEVERPFDLIRGPLFRASLFRLAEEEHILVLTLHHIITDGWSMQVLLRELTIIYGAFSSGNPSPLPPLPIQYSQFATQQRHRGKDCVRQDELLFWKERLENFTSTLDLPTNRPRPATQSFKAGSQSVVIPSWLTAELRAFSLSEGVTLFMTLLAAFQTLLYRYTRQEDIAIGSPFAGRMFPELRRSIGLFIETLVLRTDLSGDPSFRGLVKRVREVSIEAYSHSDVPFEELAKELKLQRNATYAPFFQVFFALQNELEPMVKLPHVDIRRFRIKRTTAMFDLALSMVETTEEIKGTLTYKCELFEDAYMSRMVQHFLILLRGIVRDPLRRISTLPLLTDVERRQLLVERNQTKKDYPDDKCIHGLFETQAIRSPDALAVIFEGTQLTYRELDRRANQLAHFLQSLGVQPGVLVALCMERSLAMIVALLGVLKAGGAYVPLDPNWPIERLELMVRDAQLPLVLSDGRHVEALSKQGVRIVSLDSARERISQESEEVPLGGASSDDLAYVIYTSGSTGKPKGVEITHRGLTNFVDAACAAFRLGPDDRILQFASLSFDTAVEEIFPCLVQGATLVLRTEEMLDSVSMLLQKCREYRVSVLDLPTAFWHELAVSLSSEELTMPKELRLVIIGGEKAMPERLAQWRRAADDRVQLLNTYGPSEATVVATMWNNAESDEAVNLLDEVPIGRTISNVETYILDKNLSPVPVGVCGEVHIGGAGLARGYLNRPELTAESFIPNSFSDQPGGRLYKTGDLGRYRGDGNIEFLGRLDNQVKLRGQRIEPAEVEAVLTRNSNVRASVVTIDGATDEERRLVAYVVLNQGCAPTAGEFRAFMKSKLPDYMIPSVFVFLESLPLTSSGKIDRRALPAPGQSGRGTDRPFVAPGTPMERQLAGIWAEVLKLQEVGAGDNFFDLGGHSLLAMQVISRVLKTFQVNFPLRWLFQGPTVSEMSNLIEELQAHNGDPKVVDTVLTEELRL
jgi:amino acid adenylation domain-containing protein